MAVAKKSSLTSEHEAIASPTDGSDLSIRSTAHASQPGGPVGDMHDLLESAFSARTDNAALPRADGTTIYDVERVVSKWCGITAMALAVCGLASLIL